MKKIISLLCMIQCCIVLLACQKMEYMESKEFFDEVNIQEQNISKENIKNPIIGEWVAKAVVYDDKVISFADNKTLAGLYDTEWLCIYEDFTYFRQSGALSIRGEYTQIDTEQFQYSYHFERKTLSMYEIDDNGKMQENMESSNKEFIVVLTNDNLNTLILSEPTKDNDELMLVFVKTENENQNNTNYAEDTFTNKFGTSTTICAQNGCSDFIASSGDTNCCIIHSNNCLKCEKYIDGDAMYCMDCLSGAANFKSSSNNSTISRGQQNALERAYEYLDYMSFSYVGLIEQLEFEGFTNSEATYAVDNCGADWYEQAVLKAEEYLEFSSFSRAGLIEQLEYEGFTSSQAEYAVNQVY